MYIISNNVSDDEVPKVTEEVKKYIESSGGVIDKHEELGKKKLAFPIKKARNAFYVLDSFTVTADTVGDIEHRIRTSQHIIRHLVVNMDEALARMAKDKVIQGKMKPRRPIEAPKAAEVRRSMPKAGEGGKISIDLDAEIEKALDSKDLK